MTLSELKKLAQSANKKQIYHKGCRVKTSDINRFTSKIEITDSCWLWKGYKDKKGYGVFSIKNKLMRSHRFSYEVFTGSRLRNLLCCHKCDVPSCVNPSHLFAGTNSDNVKDAIKKGRFVVGRPYRKMTVENVEEIRSSKEIARVLAKKFGVNISTIYRAKTRHKNGLWKLVPYPQDEPNNSKT